MSRDHQMPEDAKGFDQRAVDVAADNADLANDEAWIRRKHFAGPTPPPDPFPVCVQVAVTDALIAGLDRGFAMSQGTLSRDSEIEVQALIVQLKCVQFCQKAKAA